jgi:3-hydroxybutyryl-CoA dehydrogenase
MGVGIAQVSAAAGYKVQLADIDLATAEKGKAKISASLNRLVEKEKMDAAERDALLANIEPVAEVAAMRDAGLIIEAATERESIKRSIFESLRTVLAQDAVLASNTSSIPITRLAQASPDPCISSILSR